MHETLNMQCASYCERRFCTQYSCLVPTCKINPPKASTAQRSCIRTKRKTGHAAYIIIMYNCLMYPRRSLEFQRAMSGKYIQICLIIGFEMGKKTETRHSLYICSIWTRCIITPFPLVLWKRRITQRAPGSDDILQDADSAAECQCRLSIILCRICHEIKESPYEI